MPSIQYFTRNGEYCYFATNESIIGHGHVEVSVLNVEYLLLWSFFNRVAEFTIWDSLQDIKIIFLD